MRLSAGNYCSVPKLCSSSCEVHKSNCCILRFICTLITHQLPLCTSTGFDEAFSIWWILLSSRQYLLICKILLHYGLRLIFWDHWHENERGWLCAILIKLKHKADSLETDKNEERKKSVLESDLIQTNYCKIFPPSWCQGAILPR